MKKIPCKFHEEIKINVNKFHEEIKININVSIPKHPEWCNPIPEYCKFVDSDGNNYCTLFSEILKEINNKYLKKCKPCQKAYNKAMEKIK